MKLDGMLYQFVVLGTIVVLNVGYFILNKEVNEFLLGALIGVMVIPKVDTIEK
jgi:hypothetical protein